MGTNTKRGFWDLKPFWCQPWSIITFGSLVIIFSWILFKQILITLALVFIILLWWIVFLILAPRTYQINSDKK
tara:strand:+ start:115 stop:333 length:219 start_codon:yes stop_codon:yes gene_type:complete